MQTAATTGAFKFACSSRSSAKPGFFKVSRLVRAVHRLTGPGARLRPSSNLPPKARQGTALPGVAVPFCPRPPPAQPAAPPPSPSTPSPSTAACSCIRCGLCHCCRCQAVPLLPLFPPAQAVRARSASSDLLAPTEPAPSVVAFVSTHRSLVTPPLRTQRFQLGTGIAPSALTRRHGGRERRVHPAEDPDRTPGCRGAEGPNKTQEGRARRHDT